MSRALLRGSAFVRGGEPARRGCTPRVWFFLDRPHPSATAAGLGGQIPRTEIIGLSPPMFRRHLRTKHFSVATKPFSAFGADVRKQRFAIKLPTNAGNGGTWTRRQPGADDQLHPRFRLRPRCPLDGWRFGQRIARRRHLLLQWCPCRRAPSTPDDRGRGELSSPITCQKIAGQRPCMLLRICSALIVASLMLVGSAQAQVQLHTQQLQNQLQPHSIGVHSLLKVPDPRG